MGFERLKEYKKVLIRNNYVEKDIDLDDLDDLALKCRESSPKDWIRVRNNCNKIWPGEKRKEVFDENGKLKEIWMYRPTDNYNELMFSIIYLQFEKTIYGVWRKISEHVDLDRYLDSTEDWICQSIRHYKKEDSHFKTLGNKMINLCAVNLINENTTIYRKRDKLTKKIIDKKVEYHEKPVSLDWIIEDPINSYNYSLPTTPEHTINIVDELKDKYKNKKHLLAWLILDCQANEPEILKYKETYSAWDAINRIKKVIQPTKYFKLYSDIINNNIYINLGFKDSVEVNYIKQILALKKDEHKKELYNFLNKTYKDCINALKTDIKDYSLSY